MTRDSIPSDLGKYQNKSTGKTDQDEGARKKPHFAEKSYQQRAKEAYDKFLSSLTKGQ